MQRQLLARYIPMHTEKCTIWLVYKKKKERPELLCYQQYLIMSVVIFPVRCSRSAIVKPKKMASYIPI